MNCSIRIETQDQSRHEVGYHSYLSTVTFEYRDTHWSTEREEELVETLLSRSFTMWWEVLMKAPPSALQGEGRSVWVVKHGYDSGD